MKKNPHAVALGRQGGRVTGPSKARATASRSARIRWALRPRDPTAESLFRAYRRASSRLLSGPEASSCAIDAGLVLSPDPKGERVGFRVFVKCIRFDEKKLLADVESGGLEARP